MHLSRHSASSWVSVDEAVHSAVQPRRAWLRERTMRSRRKKTVTERGVKCFSAAVAAAAERLLLERLLLERLLLERLMLERLVLL